MHCKNKLWVVLLPWTLQGKKFPDKLYGKWELIKNKYQYVNDITSGQIFIQTNAKLQEIFLTNQNRKMLNKPIAYAYIKNKTKSCICSSLFVVFFLVPLWPVFRSLVVHLSVANKTYPGQTKLKGLSVIIKKIFKPYRT